MLTITHRTYIRSRVYTEMGISPMSNWVAQKKSLPHIGAQALARSPKAYLGFFVFEACPLSLNDSASAFLPF